MSNYFTIHRIVCANVPGMEEEREAFLAAVAEFAGNVAMPARILLAPASFRDPFDANVNQGLVKSNIKTSVFFIGIFGQDPVDKVHQRFVEYAVECAEDPNLPMKRATVLFKDAGDVAPEIVSLREHFTGMAPEFCQVRTFAKSKELPELFMQILGEWFAMLPAASNATQEAPASQ